MYSAFSPPLSLFSPSPPLPHPSLSPSSPPPLPHNSLPTAVGALAVLSLSFGLGYHSNLGVWDAVWSSCPPLCNMSLWVSWSYDTHVYHLEWVWVLCEISVPILHSIIALSLFLVPLQSSFAKPQTPTDVGKPATKIMSCRLQFAGWLSTEVWIQFHVCAALPTLLNIWHSIKTFYDGTFDHTILHWIFPSLQTPPPPNLRQFHNLSACFAASSASHVCELCDSCNS